MEEVSCPVFCTIKYLTGFLLLIIYWLLNAAASLAKIISYVNKLRAVLKCQQ